MTGPQCVKVQLFGFNFRELREMIKPEILELIRKHRLTYLEGGSRFPKFDNRGNRTKSKNHSRLCKLDSYIRINFSRKI